MGKILAEISKGELLDKISILEIKKERIADQESAKFIEKEYLILKDQLDKNINYNEKLEKLFNKLKNINISLWKMEDEKRSYEKNSDFGNKFIKVSRDIHFFNDDRSNVKLEINKITGSLIREIKQYTSY